MTKYILVILSPTGEEKRFESPTPFMLPARGDTLNMTLFQDADGLNLPLRVTSVEHMVWQENGAGPLNQMVALYPERCSLD